MALALVLAVVGLWVAMLLRGVRAIRKPLAPSAARFPGAVTAYVPARNEAEVIEACVRGLDLQGPNLARIVVIDDGSTDGTGERLAAMEVPRLEVRAGRGPGPGECGKPAALRDAVRDDPPGTEWLLFADADVVLEPGAVAAMLELAEARGADLVSGFLAVELGSAVERVVMPSVGAVIVASYPVDRVEDPADPLAFANGQLILVRRARYEAVGGHQAVIAEILEDVRLAGHLKRSGARLAIADLRRLARTRMYTSWRELSEGWAKNLFLLMDERPGRAVSWAIFAPLLGTSGLVAWAALGGWQGFLVWAFVTGAQAALRVLGGTSPLWAWSAPVGALAFSYLMLESMWLHRAGRRIPWKGRSYGPGPGGAG